MFVLLWMLLCSFTKKKTGSVFPAFCHATFHHALITCCNVSRAGYIAWCITIGIHLILVKATWPRISQWLSLFSWVKVYEYNNSIYRTGADSVRSCLATKPISTSWRAFALSFDHFFFALSLLKSSYFFFERGLRHIFYVKGENTTPAPFNFKSGNMYMLHDRVSRFI